MQTLHDDTGTAVQVLGGSSVICFTVDGRMRRAQGHNMKPEEDASYSLLSFFNVQRLLLYGERRVKVWHRLWRENREHHSVDLPIATSAHLGITMRSTTHDVYRILAPSCQT